uniref:Uncharacterized protein n=1 Tax=Trypanosoma congolense (strain IL3000) TaxID=1068625 RepID=G0UQ63_TRYCI|nr:conserved hypothetical protein [Trypanosoma congolense IL3000]
MQSEFAIVTRKLQARLSAPEHVLRRRRICVLCMGDGAIYTALSPSFRLKHTGIAFTAPVLSTRLPAGYRTSSSSADAMGSGLTVPARTPTPRALKLHNMPRSWMYEEVVEFIHQVAEHAGIEVPPSYCRGQSGVEGEEGEEDSAVPHVASPFISRIHIPFGRQTGIVYGSPIIFVNSDSLADYLLHDLTFDPDDYRSRIYFTEVEAGKDTESPRGMSVVDDETALEMEQQHALSSMELDRYLLAPDLLYDMAKMRQWRLVTRKSKLLLHTFGDDEGVADHGKSGVSGEMDTSGIKQGSSKANQKRLRCAGDHKELGRGSVHSIPLPLPYVRGRRGT